MGKCPECSYTPIAPSCSVCPRCGNRHWLRFIGTSPGGKCGICAGTGHTKYYANIDHFFNFVFSLLGDKNECLSCKGTGISSVVWQEYLDHRTGETVSKIKE